MMPGYWADRRNPHRDRTAPASGVMVDAVALRLLLADHDVARTTYMAALHHSGMNARTVCRCGHDCPAEARTDHYADVLIHHTEVWLIEPDP